MQWTPTRRDSAVLSTVLPCGVPVLWHPAPGPTTASLIFRVGVMDEALPTRGSTHLVEHLAHTRLGLPPYPHDAGVSARHTTFDVRGTPEQVASHLRVVATALADLPVERLEAELDVLRLEGERHPPGLWDHLRTTRHGVRGFGLLATDEIALHSTTAAQVRAWSQHHFTAHNAVLWVHGSALDLSDLPLLAGTALGAPAAFELPQVMPAWFTGDPAIVAFTTTADDDPAVLAGWWWLHRSLQQRLRLRDGAVYDIDVGVQTMVPGRLELAMAARSTPGRAQQVLNGVQQVTALACSTDMPSTELEAWRSLHLEDLSTSASISSIAHAAPPSLDPRERMRQLDAVARALLLTSGTATSTPGGPDGPPRGSRRDAQHLVQGGVDDVVEALAEAHDAKIARARSLDAADVRESLAEAMGRALLQVPAGVDGPEAMTAVAAFSEHGVREGRTYVAARHLDGLRRLVIGADGVMFEPLPAVQSTVLWSRCAAVLRHGDGRRVLVGDDATVVTVDPAEWAHARAAVRAIDAAAPPHLVVDVCGSDGPFRRPPRVLSGAASMSTSALVALVVGVGLFTAFLLSVAPDSTHPIFAWTFTALTAVTTSGLVAALVSRLRSPRASRTTLTTRGRTHAAVAVNHALARAEGRSVRTIAVCAWAVAVLLVVVGAWYRFFFWPAGFTAAFAISVTREARRREYR